MIFSVYVLRSDKEDYVYVGMTGNLERRIKQHNSGKVVSTKHYKPFKIIYSEDCPDGTTARAREKYLKSSAGKNYLRFILDK